MIARTGKPHVDFPRVGDNGCLCTRSQTSYGKTEPFPSLCRAHAPAHVRGNFLPRSQRNAVSRCCHSISPACDLPPIGFSLRVPFRPENAADLQDAELRAKVLRHIFLRSDCVWAQQKPPHRKLRSNTPTCRRGPRVAQSSISNWNRHFSHTS